MGESIHWPLDAVMVTLMRGSCPVTGDCRLVSSYNGFGGNNNPRGRSPPGRGVGGGALTADGREPETPARSLRSFHQTPGRVIRTVRPAGSPSLARWSVGLQEAASLPPVGDDELDLVSSVTTGNTSSFPSASDLNRRACSRCFFAGTSRAGRSCRSEAVLSCRVGRRVLSLIGSGRTVVERAGLA